MKVRTGLRVPTRAIPSWCTAGYAAMFGDRLAREMLTAYNRAAKGPAQVFDATQTAIATIRRVLQDAEIIVRAESSERAAARLAAMGGV